MGVDLTLYFDTCAFMTQPERPNPRGSSDWLFLTHHMQLNRFRALWDRIEAVESHPIDPDITVRLYGRDEHAAEEGQVDTSGIDAYGRPIRWVRAGDLAAVPLGDEGGPWNEAVWAMLAALPSKLRVYLYWN